MSEQMSQAHINISNKASYQTAPVLTELVQHLHKVLLEQREIDIFKTESEITNKTNSQNDTDMATQPMQIDNASNGKSSELKLN